MAAARETVRSHEIWLASRFTRTEREMLADLLARLHQ